MINDETALTTKPEFSKAVEQARGLALILQQSDGNLQPFYDAFEIAIAEIETESKYSVETLVPANSESGLAFYKTKDGKDFWEAYKNLVVEAICDPEGEFYLFVMGGATYESIEIFIKGMELVVESLGLPLWALSIAHPIVALVIVKGIVAFCKIARE